MLILISPAKIQNFRPNDVLKTQTFPYFMDEATQLVALLRKYSPKELMSLLEVNSDIASSSSDRYYNWSGEKNTENAKPAILVYAGEVYRGLQADTFTSRDFQFAQNHLRMFSALYGILRPTDLIRPYRLEMNARLPNTSGKDLYAFWRVKLTDAVNQSLPDSGKPETIINLSSNEYFKTLDRKKLNARIIDFDFLDSKNGRYKTITVYMKKARGMMARYIIRNQITEVEELKGFDSEGYWFNASLSTDNKLVFTRDNKTAMS